MVVGLKKKRRGVGIQILLVMVVILVGHQTVKQTVVVLVEVLKRKKNTLKKGALLLSVAIPSKAHQWPH